MSAGAVSLVVLALVAGGAACGALLRSRLPEDHLRGEASAVVMTGIGLLATLAALVLGLLIASAKGALDTKASGMQELAANIVRLDRSLRQYGPETKPIRDVVRQAVAVMADPSSFDSESRANTRVPGDGSSSAANVEDVEGLLRSLSPRDDTQRAAQARSLQLSNEIGQTRWLLFAQRGSSIPVPFLMVLVGWLAVIFGILGLLAPRNRTVYSIIFVCALSVSSALYLILALDRPFDGLLRISDLPLRSAISQLNQ